MLLTLLLLILLLLLYSSAETSVTYEDEKDASSTVKGHITAPKQPVTNPEQQTGNGLQTEKKNAPDTLSLGTSVNYPVPSDSDIEDDLHALAAALAPSKIQQ